MLALSPAVLPAADEHHLLSDSAIYRSVAAPQVGEDGRGYQLELLLTKLR